MIPLLAFLMQSATVMPNYVYVTDAEPAKVVVANDRCSVHMPRVAIPKDVKFQMEIIKPTVTDIRAIVAPAPECPAPKSEK